ncbi:YciI family protein [Cellulomonas endometrii]|uniref:YciI family protein n=1 Tax=Cellulomonas endometrii TaxID=3036301 RepID=UPI0024AE324C|nr:YciI family protein [Cellulomonas endometrii]
MTYVTFVRVGADAAPTAEEADPTAWVERADRAGRREGHRLAEAGSATTVRVRDGRTLVTDGPFAEYKELVGGFDVLDVPDLEQAVALAAEHPAARFGAIEVREVWPFDGAEPDGHVLAPDEAGAGHYLLLMGEVPDGTPQPDEPPTAWAERMRGTDLGGHRLRPPAEARTVRVRDGRTVVARGPYAEVAEQVAGVALIAAPDLDAAIDVAAQHPAATAGAVEIRPLWQW